MAAATRLLARSGTCVAVLNYDDLTLLASGFTVANIGGSEPITFYMIVNGQTLSATVNIGQTHVTTFPLAIAITIGVSALTGAPTFLMAGVTEYGIGSS
jgi:hypothetical protein